jgi:hypothetical protein
MTSSESEQLKREKVKEDNYYDILSFLETSANSGSISKDKLKDFKKIIRDNKYVATYIISLKPNLDEIKDFNTLKTKLTSIDDKWDVNPNIRSLFTWNPTENPDAIKILSNLVEHAIARKGKICDFRDSVYPQTIMGVCQGDDHAELYLDAGLPTTGQDEDEEPIIPEMIEKLEMTLCQDEDTSKFDDHSPTYICKRCMEDLQENREGSEVSCDMDYN